MIKTKMFTDYKNYSVDVQINSWLSKHPDYIVKDVKLSTHIIDTTVICIAMVIYREYENV